VIKRIIEISTAGTYLSVKLGQLVVKQDGEIKGQIPCEDIGVLLVWHTGVSYSHAVFTELLKYGAAIILCDGHYLPAGMMLPLESNTVQTERFRTQIEAKEPVKKQLWRQLIRAKIAHQADVVKEDEKTSKFLKGLRDQVRSGDPDNIEAQASKRFWAAFMPKIISATENTEINKKENGMTEAQPGATAKPQAVPQADNQPQQIEFRREAEGGMPPNNFLNYGYMVMRAAVARAICSAGLLPTLGIHHRNKYNAFCLADDVLEPFRGFVEKKVRGIVQESKDLNELQELNPARKAKLLEVLYEPVEIAGFTGPLMVGLHRTAASLQRCLAGEQKDLELPY
jgi:CRISPR-associated protein Cas1